MKKAVLLGLLVGLFACATKPYPGDAGSDGAAQPASCPAAIPDSRSSCAGAKDGTVCRYTSPDGTSRCSCNSGQWLCDSCNFVPYAYPEPLFSCATERVNGCTLDTWEWQIRCYCLQPEQRGVCCGSDSLDGYENCRPERQRDGAPCCASCDGTAVDGGTQRCTCGPDHRFRCTTT